MSPKQTELTPEQLDTIHELQRELDGLDAARRSQWKKWVKTGDLDCFNEVVALDGEIALKELVAHVPTAGEKKVGRVRDLVNRARTLASESAIATRLRHHGIEDESRLAALDVVNGWRESVSLPPLDRLPKGVVGDSHDCTLARAFAYGIPEDRFHSIEVSGSTAEVALRIPAAEVTTSDAYLDDEYGVRNYRISDPAFQAVIGAFDEGHLPDLIEDDEALLTRAAEMIDDGLSSSPDAEWTVLDDMLDEIERRNLVDALLERTKQWSWRTVLYDPEHPTWPWTVTARVDASAV